MDRGEKEEWKSYILVSLDDLSDDAIVNMWELKEWGVNWRPDGLDDALVELEDEKGKRDELLAHGNVHHTVDKLRGLAEERCLERDLRLRELRSWKAKKVSRKEEDAAEDGWVGLTVAEVREGDIEGGGGRSLKDDTALGEFLVKDSDVSDEGSLKLGVFLLEVLNLRGWDGTDLAELSGGGDNTW